MTTHAPSGRQLTDWQHYAPAAFRLGVRSVIAAARFVGRSAMEFVNINGLYLAAAIAYYSFMSLLPLSLVLIWASRQIIGIEQFDQRLVEGIEGVVPVLNTAGGHSFISEFIGRAVASNVAVTLFSLIGTFLGALGVFGAIRKSMNEIWGVPQARNLIIQRAIDVTLMIGAMCVLFASLILAMALTFIQQIISVMLPDAPQISPVIYEVVRWLGPLCLTFFSITVIYSWLPNVNVRLREVMLVSFLTTLAFEVVKAGFIFYLEQVAPSLVSFYGSVSTLMFFFYFVYAQSIVLLLGAMFSVKWVRRNRYHRFRIPA